MKADVNLIDHQALKINTPYYANDLPANAPRWMQTVSGIKRTFVKGISTFVDGVPTGNLPGGLVRNQYAFSSPKNLDATYDDQVRAEILAQAAAAGTVGRTQFTPAWRTHWPPTTCGSVYTVHHGCLEGGLHLVRLTQPLR